jgi:hypothetical protein
MVMKLGGMFIPPNFTGFAQFSQTPIFVPPNFAPTTPATFQGNFSTPNFTFQSPPTFDGISPHLPISQPFSEWSEEDEIEREADALSDLTSLDENSIMMMKHFDENIEDNINEEVPLQIRSNFVSKLARITDFTPEWDFTEGG